MRESAVERRLGRLIKGMGGMSIKILPVIAGMPDRLIVLPGGRVIFVELKADKGQVSPIQKVWFQRMENLGHPVTVLYGSKGVDEFVHQLEDVVD